LNQWLTTLGLSRADVYIANVLKCRPPGNRDPRHEEVDRCSPFLQAQIRAIAPAVLVALGRHAGMLLSKRDDLSLRAMRGATLHYEVQATGDRATAHRIPIVVTYHPAYVLRQEGSEGDGEAAERLVMQDLERALAWVRSADAPRS
ncbi:MAG: uracil-DNA glycosylase, partial [Nannocystaceae bacterium]|nr:uracil-DNA glycosylase [Nannocystaceae bacterium]